MGLFDGIKSQMEASKFKRSPLGQALRQHTHDFFYSGHTLSWMKEENKRRFADELMGHLTAAQASENAPLALREKLSEAVLSYSKLAILALTEEEKAGGTFADCPYVSGELHHRIEQAAPLNDDLKHIIWQNDGEMSHEELIATANTRSALALYFANGLNMARIAIGDTDPAKDWYRPFVEAMMVWEEDTIREKLDLPALVPGLVRSLPYAQYLNFVVDGERNPFFTWTQQWPDLYLAGEGFLASQGHH